MRWQSEEQRKAVMAKLKRAALGAAIAGTAGVLAYRMRGTPLAKKALAVAAGGLATAASYGGQAVEKARQAVEKAEALGRGTADWALEKARQVPVEDIVAGAIDYPFSWAEGALASEMDKRVARIEHLAAKRLGQAQAGLTVRLAEKARGMQERLLGLPKYESTRTRGSGGTPGYEAHLARREAYKARLEQLVREHRRLRREAQALKWKEAVNRAIQETLRTGKSYMTASNEEIDDLLRRAGIEPTTANRIRFKQITLQTPITGLDLVWQSGG
jgi:hypothetical protein